MMWGVRTWLPSELEDLRRLHGSWRFGLRFLPFLRALGLQLPSLASENAKVSCPLRFNVRQSDANPTFWCPSRFNVRQADANDQA